MNAHTTDAGSPPPASTLPLGDERTPSPSQFPFSPAGHPLPAGESLPFADALRAASLESAEATRQLNDAYARFITGRGHANEMAEAERRCYAASAELDRLARLEWRANRPAAEYAEWTVGELAEAFGR